jgi:hypothetical protein
MKMRPRQFATLTVETCVACHCAARAGSKSGFPAEKSAWEIEPTLLMSVRRQPSARGHREPDGHMRPVPLTARSCQ